MAEEENIAGARPVDRVELKRCPFCGGKMVVTAEYSYCRRIFIYTIGCENGKCILSYDDCYSYYIPHYMLKTFVAQFNSRVESEPEMVDVKVENLPILNKQGR